MMKMNKMKVRVTTQKTNQMMIMMKMIAKRRVLETVNHFNLHK